MAQIISASIDLTKLDKSKIIPGKNGQKFYPLNIIVNDEKNKFDQDVSITDSQTKEQRSAKEKRNYLGNGKVVWEKAKTIQGSEVPGNNSSAADDDHDGLPF